MVTQNDLGVWLKGLRNDLDVNQETITKSLGYKNLNFISMIERGKANIPSNMIVMFSRAYNADQVVFMAATLISTYPEMWSNYLYFMKISGFIEDEYKFENDVTSKIMKKINTYHM